MSAALFSGLFRAIVIKRSYCWRCLLFFGQNFGLRRKLTICLRIVMTPQKVYLMLYLIRDGWVCVGRYSVAGHNSPLHSKYSIALPPTGRVRLIRSLSSARFSFELSAFVSVEIFAYFVTVNRFSKSDC